MLLRFGYPYPILSAPTPKLSAILLTELMLSLILIQNRSDYYAVKREEVSAHRYGLKSYPLPTLSDGGNSHNFSEHPFLYL